MENASSSSVSILLRVTLLQWANSQHVSLGPVSHAAVIWVVTLRDDISLGHATLGNFSTDQLVVKLTEISQWRINTENELNRNTKKRKGNIDRKRK